MFRAKKELPHCETVQSSPLTGEKKRGKKDYAIQVMESKSTKAIDFKSNKMADSCVCLHEETCGFMSHSVTYAYAVTTAASPPGDDAVAGDDGADRGW